MSRINPSFLLFVPGDRPDRFAKALASEASGAILDLEDAVAPERKAQARQAVAAYLDASPNLARVVVRVNAPDSPWFDEDLTMLRTRGPRTVIIPKTAHAFTLDTVAAALDARDVIAMVESASGLLHAAEIAAHPSCLALAFGPYDLAAELGATVAWDVLAPYRSQMLLAARAHGKLAIDGPTITFNDPSPVETEARAAESLGYDGKLLIHPAQIASTRRAFLPSEEKIVHARRVLAAAEQAMPAVLDGMMIDRPLVLSARRILQRAYTP